MQYLLISFISGLLTILAPCVLPVLPVVLGSSLQEVKNRKRPITVVTSSAISIVVFTLLLKSSTLLIDIDPSFWSYLSGGIIAMFGLISLFPSVWEKIELKLNLSTISGKLLHRSNQKKGFFGDILVGASLGPVFASCSPTYAVIVAVILPQSFFIGLLNLLIYALGFSLILILTALLGQKFLSKLKWAINPKGIFKKALGILFVLLGIAIMTGYEKKIEIALLDAGLGDITKIEGKLLESTKPKKEISTDSILNIEDPYPAPELKDIEAWINSEGFTIEELKGKVVILDFWTYTCINCIRTLPYLNEWHEKYADQGLVIIGVHAPEFQFEQKLSNVQKAVDEFELKYPIVLDNDFSTWRAYENQYWPAKYFIDKEGMVRHTHFGEGEYEESEEIIRLLLEETGSNLKSISIGETEKNLVSLRAQTPETYINYSRGANLSLKNTQQFIQDKVVDYELISQLRTNEWSLGGKWEINEEHSVSKQEDAKLSFAVSAKDVYLVMGAQGPAQVKVEITGDKTNLSTDVDNQGILELDEFRLYHLISLEDFDSNLEFTLTFDNEIQINAFTFGG